MQAPGTEQVITKYTPILPMRSFMLYVLYAQHMYIYYNMVHFETHPYNVTGCASRSLSSALLVLISYSMSKSRTKLVLFAWAPAVQLLVTAELAGRQFADSLRDASTPSI